MARDWPHLPQFQSEEDASATAPDGWSTRQIEDIFDKLEIGKRYDQKTCSASGKVPVIDQSAEGLVGYHDDQPGVTASKISPVITFANHTCEMRVMRRPFSVIQNVFPMVGRLGVCETLFFYYATKGRVHLEEYKGHYPDFRRLWINLPPLAEQKAIAAVLGALDDKIELNRRMNATLEATARALFQSWFVDFDPVRAKMDGRKPAGMDATAAALFPGSFQDSPLGHIPAGWKVERVSDVMTFEGGTQPPASEFIDEPREGYVRLVQIRDFYTSGHVTFVPDTRKLRKFTTDDLMLARYGSSGNAAKGSDSLGRVCRGMCGAYNVALVKVIPIRPLSEFLFCYLKSNAFQSTIKGMGARSVQSGFRKEDLDVIYLVTAPQEIHEAFERFASDLWRKTYANHQETRTLATLRDTLLPKLLSGELSVADVSKTLPR